MNYLGKIKPSVSGCDNARRSDKLSLKIKGKREYLYAITDDQTKFLIRSTGSRLKIFCRNSANA